MRQHAAERGGERHRLGGSGARSRCCAKRARASSADTTSRNCSCRAAARTRASRSASASGFDPARIAHCPSHGHGLTRPARPRIAFAVGRHQNPAVGLRQRLQRQIAARLAARRHRRRAAPARPRRGRRGRDLARKRQVSTGSLAAMLPASRASMRRPMVSQTASAASSRPGSSSTGCAPTKPKRRGLARRERDAVHRDAAGARQRVHAGVVAAAAGAADGDDGVGVSIGQGAISRIMPPRRAAPRRHGVDVACDQPRRADDDRLGTHRHDPQTRGSRTLTARRRRRQDGEIEWHAGARRRGAAAPSRRNRAPAGSTPSPGLTGASASARPSRPSPRRAARRCRSRPAAAARHRRAAAPRQAAPAHRRRRRACDRRRAPSRRAAPAARRAAPSARTSSASVACTACVKANHGAARPASPRRSISAKHLGERRQPCNRLDPSTPTPYTGA